jgi:hypothetical protein
MAKKKTTSVLTGNQLREVRTLLKSKEAENVKTAIQLLQSAEATRDDWSDVFSSRTISLMVNTWDVAVWNEVADGLEAHRHLHAEFGKLAVTRFNKLSEDTRLSFPPYALESVKPSLASILWKVIKGREPIRKGRRVETDLYADVYYLIESGQEGPASGRGRKHGTAVPLTSLSDVAAEIVRKWKGDLHLSNVTALSDAAAESLGKHKGRLFLDGLTELSDAAAVSLGNHKGNLFLDGLTSLTDKAAENLRKSEPAKRSGGLNLKGLTELSDAAAKSLAMYRGELRLGYSFKNDSRPGRAVGLLTDLSDTAIESLSKHRGPGPDRHKRFTNDGLHLGLTELSDAAAKSLSKYKGSDLDFVALTELSDATVKILSKYKGHLELNLTSLSDAAAESLSKHKGDDSRRSPSDRVGHLTLDALTSLSDAAAESLAKHKGHLDLNGLSELSDAAAESLSRHVCHARNGRVGVQLHQLPDAAARILRDAGHGYPHI